MEIKFNYKYTAENNFFLAGQKERRVTTQRRVSENRTSATTEFFIIIKSKYYIAGDFFSFQEPNKLAKIFFQLPHHLAKSTQVKINASTSNKNRLVIAMSARFFIQLYTSKCWPASNAT